MAASPSLPFSALYPPLASPVPSTSSSPLSPEIVSSLRINYLDLGLPRFQQTVDSSSLAVAASSNGSALEQDTLAMRRMKAASAKSRPPLFRRRSKSLDDVDGEQAEDAAREMRSEAAASAVLAAVAEISIDTNALPLIEEDYENRLTTPLTAMSAASFSTFTSSATTVPTSTTTSTFTAATMAPSLSCGMSSHPSMLSDVPQSTSTAGLHLETRSVSAPGFAPLDFSLLPTGHSFPPPSVHPPQPAPTSDSLVRSQSASSASECRLASWVNSVTAASSGSTLPAPVASAAVSLAASLSTTSISTAPNRFPISHSSRQPYTPVLPSPLSTCSYTSGDGERDRMGGFPFPSAASPSFAGASGEQSEFSSDGSPPVGSMSAPATSPGLLRSSFIGGGGGSRERPHLHSYASGSTVATASTAGTATAAPSPLAFPSSAGGTPALSTLSGRPRKATLSTPSPYVALSSASPSSSSSALPLPSSSSRPPSRIHTRSFSHSFATLDPFSPPPIQQPSPTAYTSRLPSSSSASASSSLSNSAPSGSAAGSPHTRTSSLSSSNRHAAPLTPPESLCTGPFLAGASASEMAWHEVLSARVGTVGSALGGAGGGGGGGRGTGSSRGGGTGGTGRWAGRREPVGVGKKETPSGNGEKKEGAVVEDEEEKKGCEGLMGNAAAGGFAASTREKMGELIEEFWGLVPLREGGEGWEEPEAQTLTIVEYGALNSRSASLVAPILSHFSTRQLSHLSPSLASDPSSLLSFQVTHCDRPSSDFRSLALQAEETYLRTSLAKEDRVFSSFAARPFGAKVVPKGSVSVGFSAMSLHWPSTPRQYRAAGGATIAYGEMMAFLSSRATEFVPGGLLVLSYIARSEENAAAAASPSSMPTTPAGSPPMPPPGTGRSASAPGAAQASHLGSSSTTSPSPSPPVTATLPPGKKDIWAHLTSVLGKAIQRLVSTGLLKPQVARQLLALPLHPRTPRQTQACLRASAHSWDTLKSEIVVLSHPAWKGVEHGTISPESWADHTIQLLKIFWESEMRSVLREALGSRGACEWVIECLFTVVKEKLEELPPHPLELEVQLVALRRRMRAPSQAPSSPVGGTFPAGITGQ